MGLFDWTKKNEPVRPAQPTPSRPLEGNFDPGAGAIQIQYVNARGETPTFTCDANSAQVKGRFLIVRAAPTGKRITLKLASIQNRSEVEARLARSPRPSGEERGVLNYHLRRGTTSRLFEDLRRKYPDYQP
jgi:hypothetical protein